MRRFFLFLPICVFFFLAGCQNKNENINHPAEHQPNENLDKATTENNSYTLEFLSEPKYIVAGENVKLLFTVKNLQSQVFKDLEIVREMPLHLIAVSEDLNEFYHLHPEQQEDGSLAANFAFPSGGKYRLYADFKPKGGEQTVRNFPVQVSGGINSPNELKPDRTFEKTVEGIKVRMEGGNDLETNKEAMLNFSVFDAVNGELAKDMEQYLGETAHFVIISQDLKDFVHAHPVSLDNVKNENLQNSAANRQAASRLANNPPNSMISIHAAFPKEGTYKIFAEFKRNGNVIVVPFVVEVKKGKSEKLMENVKIPDGAFKIVVNRDGFAPNEISLSKDKFKKIAFLRVDEGVCDRGITFTELQTLKKLPIGEVVLLDIPKNKTGELHFTCNNGKFNGTVTLQ